MLTTTTKTFRLLPRALQAKLASREATGRIYSRPRPLGDVNEAMKALDLSSTEIIQLLQNSDLRGFNIATDADGFPRYRVLARSLEYFKVHLGSQRLDLEWDEIWKLLFEKPALHSVLTGPQIQRALNCTRQHVTSLAPHFKIMRQARPGRGNAARFAAVSVEAWLKGRLL